MFIFSETAAGRFMVSRKDVSVVAAADGIALCTLGSLPDDTIDFTDKTTPIVITGRGLAMGEDDSIRFELRPGRGDSTAILDLLKVYSSSDTEIRVFNTENTSLHPDSAWSGQDVLVVASIGGAEYTHWVKFNG